MSSFGCFVYIYIVIITIYNVNNFFYFFLLTYIAINTILIVLPAPRQYVNIKMSRVFPFQIFLGSFFCLQAQLRTISAGTALSRHDLRPAVSTNNCAYSFPGKNLPGKKIIKPKPNKAQKKSEPDNSDPDQARSPMWGKFYPLSFHKVNVPSVDSSLPK